MIFHDRILEPLDLERLDRLELSYPDLPIGTTSPHPDRAESPHPHATFVN
jgi:hypothetical protein